MLLSLIGKKFELIVFAFLSLADRVGKVWFFFFKKFYICTQPCFQY